MHRSASLVYALHPRQLVFHLVRTPLRAKMDLWWQHLIIAHWKIWHCAECKPASALLPTILCKRILIKTRREREGGIWLAMCQRISDTISMKSISCHQPPKISCINYQSCEFYHNSAIRIRIRCNDINQMKGIWHFSNSIEYSYFVALDCGFCRNCSTWVNELLTIPKKHCSYLIIISNYRRY